MQRVNEENNCKSYFLAMFVISILVFIICFTGEKPEQVSQKLNAVINSNCWEKFKLLNCDLNNPLGNICRQLYDCYLTENQKSQKIEEKKENTKNDSIVDEMLIISFVAFLSSYYLGLENIKKMVYFVISARKHIFDILEEFQKRK